MGPPPPGTRHSAQALLKEGCSRTRQATSEHMVGATGPNGRAGRGRFTPRWAECVIGRGTMECHGFALQQLHHGQCSTGPPTERGNGTPYTEAGYHIHQHRPDSVVKGLVNQELSVDDGVEKQEMGAHRKRMAFP